MAMEVTFWGVRGSTACSSSAYAFYGGHTSCVSVTCASSLIIFDAGTGLYDLGNWIQKQEIKEAHLILTHFHLDHVIGLPFFAPLWDPSFKLTLHFACKTPGLSTLEKFLKGSLFSPPLFPAPFEQAQDHIALREHSVGKTFCPAPDIRITSAPLTHPGGATGYRLSFQNTVVSYITDTEHHAKTPDPHVLKLMKDGNLVIYDATYTEEEYTDKKGWGHSTWQEALKLAQRARVKKLALFHHNPAHTDEILKAIEEEAQQIFPSSLVARQGMNLRL